MDAWGWAPGTSAVQAAALPRVDVGRTIVNEGDSGTRTYRIPVEVTGRGSGQVRLYVLDPDGSRTQNRLVTVRPGSDTVHVPVEVKGDTAYSDDTDHDIAVKAVRGAVVGKHRGARQAVNTTYEAPWEPSRAGPGLSGPRPQDPLSQSVSCVRPTPGEPRTPRPRRQLPLLSLTGRKRPGVVAQSFCVASVATSWGFSVLWVVFLVGGVLGVRG